jgi:hypothetical protein
MQFVFHPKRIEVAFAGDVVYHNLVWEAFRGEMTSSFQYLLDNIVFVNRTKRAVVGTNLYVWEMSKRLGWGGVGFSRKPAISGRYDCCERGWIVLNEF